VALQALFGTLGKFDKFFAIQHFRLRGRYFSAHQL
jgi:hypothetical protein